MYVQLAGVANGLKYMHNLRVVHGDLKGVLFFSFQNETFAHLRRKHP